MQVPCCAVGSEPGRGIPCAFLGRVLEADIFTIQFFLFIVVRFTVSLSQLTFRIYGPTFMYLILGLWSGGWQHLLAILLVSPYQVEDFESSLPSYFLNTEVIRAQEAWNHFHTIWQNCLSSSSHNKGTETAGEKNNNNNNNNSKIKRCLMVHIFSKQAHLKERLFCSRNTK